MELEGYIDRLNNAIEWLESEQLTVTNNIINLKAEYNQSKFEYDELSEKLQAETKKYSELLMSNARMTYTQNKDILEEIEESKKQSLERKIELDQKEAEFLTKMSEVCAKESDLKRKEIYLNAIEIEIKRKEKDIAQQIVTQTAKETKINAQIQANEKRTIQLSEKIKSSEETKEKLEKAQEKLAIESALSKNEYEMKIKDLERRENEIIIERLQIVSEWKSLKNAKAHIESLKQGIQ